MLRNINSGIYKNTEIFQQISDSQAAFVSGGTEIPASVSNLSDLIPKPNLSTSLLPKPFQNVIDNVSSNFLPRKTPDQ
ncbi:hypothetical protein A0J48_006275 [Sphaerospermopsis aphanizomenoides BCCUSP55]|uniref:hypothetical protein n=1 Tax=Sphaerospermopsis aphanizomenoides TaxID=459663 RepID=UPI001903C689|nr:hypothetical protein [Sphaerospermopsis aphanizomenoides]MBK1987146.1 hypothetical protein [Sphaerospermopsis aphanizomenoides BCCUSP55]